MRFNGQVLTLAELVSRLSAEHDFEISGNSLVKFRILPHCTEQAVAPSEALLWQKIYTKTGSSVEIKNLGCCGMAGTYGHLQENESNSKGLFALNWKDTATKDDEVINLASGFSCRSQANNLANLTIQHPIEVLNNMVTGIKQQTI